MRLGSDNVRTHTEHRAHTLESKYKWKYLLDELTRIHVARFSSFLFVGSVKTRFANILQCE